MNSSDVEEMEIDSSLLDYSVAGPSSCTRSSGRRRNAVIRPVKSTGKRKSSSIPAPNVVTPNDRPLNAGKIYYWENVPIGHGGTANVYQGFFQDMNVPAAVKIIGTEFAEIIKNEIEIVNYLLRQDESRNIIKYYAHEEDKNGKVRYIAMQFAEDNLDSVGVPKKTINFSNNDLKRFAFEACNAVHLLHTGKRNFAIVHRDIKPSNFLLKKSEDTHEFTVKITDFGISKFLTEYKSSTTTNAQGTYDWMSPDVLSAATNSPPTSYNASLKDDIFSLGLVLYFIMTRGKHPFDPIAFRVPNILLNKTNFGDLSSAEGALCLDLVRAMLHPQKSLRPGMNEVMKHPFFWKEEEILDFFVEFSNNTQPSSKLLNNGHFIHNRIQSSLQFICQCPVGWTAHLCPNVQSFLSKTKKNYSGQDVRKLVELIRDKWQHRIEWDQELRDPSCWGQDKASYISYFMCRFPLLLPVVYAATKGEVKFYHEIELQNCNC